MSAALPGSSFSTILGGETLVEFGEDPRRRFSSSEAMMPGARGRKIFHDGARSAGCRSFQLFVGDAELHAAQRIGSTRLTNPSGWCVCGKPGLQRPNDTWSDDALEQAANRAGSPTSTWVRRNSVFPLVRTSEDQRHDAHYFAAAGVDDLLVEQIFLHRKPGLVGFIECQGTLANVQALSPDRTGGHLVVAGDQRRKCPRASR